MYLHVHAAHAAKSRAFGKPARGGYGRARQRLFLAGSAPLAAAARQNSRYAHIAGLAGTAFSRGACVWSELQAGSGTHFTNPAVAALLCTMVASCALVSTTTNMPRFVISLVILTPAWPRLAPECGSAKTTLDTSRVQCHASHGR